MIKIALLALVADAKTRMARRFIDMHRNMFVRELIAIGLFALVAGAGIWMARRRVDTAVRGAAYVFLHVLIEQGLLTLIAEAKYPMARRQREYIAQRGAFFGTVHHRTA